MTIRLAERELKTKYGAFREVLYYDGRAESIALVMGDVAGAENVLCRIHSACIGGHVFNSIECECADEMAAAQAAIQKTGSGVIIYLDQEGKGNGHLALIESMKFKKEFGQTKAYAMAGYREDARDYLPAAAILRDLEITSVQLITNNPSKVSDLSELGINISSTFSN